MSDYQRPPTGVAFLFCTAVLVSFTKWPRPQPFVVRPTPHRQITITVPLQRADFVYPSADRQA